MPRHAGAPPVADTRTATAALLHPNAVAVVGASEDARSSFEIDLFFGQRVGIEEFFV